MDLIITYRDTICPFCLSSNINNKLDFEKTWQECFDCESRGPSFYYGENVSLVDAKDMALNYWQNRYRSE